MNHSLIIEETWVPRYSDTLSTVGDSLPADRPSPPPPDDEISAAFGRLARIMCWSSRDGQA